MFAEFFLMYRNKSGFWSIFLFIYKTLVKMAKLLDAIIERIHRDLLYILLMGLFGKNYGVMKIIAEKFLWWKL